MSQAGPTRYSRLALYVGLTGIFVCCLWIGWSDFDVRMTQTEVRESIRFTIRQVIQFAVQFAIPIAILVFFIKEIIRWLQSRGA